MPAASRGQASRSKVLHGVAAGGWEGIAPLPYRRGDAPGADGDPGGAPGASGAVTRWLLAGGPGSGCAFELRYFELAPGAYTSHERHLHEHAVVVLRGAGEVRLGDASHALRAGDLVRVAADEPHQFRNAGLEPFGFFCVVDADRDRPIPVGEVRAPSCDV
jgi:quercetin dioxygenase-like cupin family protein